MFPTQMVLWEPENAVVGRRQVRSTRWAVRYFRPKLAKSSLVCCAVRGRESEDIFCGWLRGSLSALHSKRHHWQLNYGPRSQETTYLPHPRKHIHFPTEGVALNRFYHRRQDLILDSFHLLGFSAPGFVARGNALQEFRTLRSVALQVDESTCHASTLMGLSPLFRHQAG